MFYQIGLGGHDTDSFKARASGYNKKGDIWKMRTLMSLMKSMNHSDVRSKTNKRLKERFLIRRNMTKRANFRESPLSQATYKTEEQTLNSIYIVSVGRGRLADGKGHETSSKEKGGSLHSIHVKHIFSLSYSDVFSNTGLTLFDY